MQGTSQPEKGEEAFWERLNEPIRTGHIVPVIGNSLGLTAIFQFHRVDLENVEEALAETWADQVGYHGPRRQSLSRIAQYLSAATRDSLSAKTQYLDFLKRHLLNLAQADPADSTKIAELRSESTARSLAEIADAVNYLEFSHFQFDDPTHPFRLLAELPLSIYITTGYHDFMERALQAAGRNPRLQVCAWTGEPAKLAPEHQPDPNFRPTVEAPLVYHLYGFEAYPETLVLSEDDYFDFLIKIAEDRNLLPSYLQRALIDSSLLLLGFQFQAWDLKVLWQGFLRSSTRLNVSMIQQSTSTEIQSYLERYFGRNNFEVWWSDPQSFIDNLWQRWPGGSRINKTQDA